MADQNDGHPLREQIMQKLSQLRLEGRVQSARWLVEEQDIGPRKQDLCQRRALLDIAHRNAREEVERVTDAVQRINGTLRLLQETAQLPVLPRRMESYDISHTGGADQVGGMVVFQDGKPLKSAYRRFRIESCAGADDYGAMREVLTRRFRRYLDGDEKFAPLPDLLLIDGGQEHAHVAEQVLAGCGLDVPVLGMVKDLSLIHISEPTRH